MWDEMNDTENMNHESDVSKLYKVICEDCLRQSQEAVRNLCHFEIGVKSFEDDTVGVKIKARPAIYNFYSVQENQTTTFFGDVYYSHNDILLLTYLKKTRRFLFEKMFTIHGPGFDETITLKEGARKEIRKVLNRWTYDFESMRYQTNGFFEDKANLNLEYMDYGTVVPTFCAMINHEVGHLIYSRVKRDDPNIPEASSLMLQQIFLFATEIAKEYQEFHQLSERGQWIWWEEFFADFFAYHLTCGFQFTHDTMNSWEISIYAMAQCMVVVELQSKYIYNLMDETDKTYPSAEIRFDAIGRFMDYIHSGKNQEGYEISKLLHFGGAEAIGHIKEIIWEERNQ